MPGNMSQMRFVICIAHFFFFFKQINRIIYILSIGCVFKINTVYKDGTVFMKKTYFCADLLTVASVNYKKEDKNIGP